MSVITVRSVIKDSKELSEKYIGDLSADENNKYLNPQMSEASLRKL